MPHRVYPHKTKAGKATRSTRGPKARGLVKKTTLNDSEATHEDAVAQRAQSYGEFASQGFAKTIKFQKAELIKILDEAFWAGQKAEERRYSENLERINVEIVGLRKDRIRFLAAARRHKNHCDLLMEKHEVRLDDVE